MFYLHELYCKETASPSLTENCGSATDTHEHWQCIGTFLRCKNRKTKNVDRNNSQRIASGAQLSLTMGLTEIKQVQKNTIMCIKLKKKKHLPTITETGLYRWSFIHVLLDSTGVGEGGVYSAAHEQEAAKML